MKIHTVDIRYCQ